MTPKIVFILGAINNSHTKNRVEEFINNGFEVQVYGFIRNGNNKTPGFPVEILGEIENGSYLNRLSLYWKSLKKIKEKHKKENVIYYLFGLDKAIFFTLFSSNIRYIYEEADLVHTYFGSKLLRYVFELLDKRVIKKSIQTVLTSDGFVRFHFGETKPQNVVVVPNRLNEATTELEFNKKKTFNKEKIKIGFVGWPRFDSVLNFIDVFCKSFPQHEFHVYGAPVSEEFQSLTKYSNYYLHGRFQNPIDLPEIYSNIDLVLSTYDVKYENVKYAEPNKIYESIYFETPIIVSDGTFLSEKVENLNIGFHLDALHNESVVSFINGLSLEIMEEKINSIRKIDKMYTINKNDKYFNDLKVILNNVESNL